MRLSRVFSGLMAAALAIAVLAAGAPPVAAGGDQLQTKGTTTYELQPARHVIHVTTVYTLVNKAPSTSRRFDCSYWVQTWYGSFYIPATCTRRTSYYYNSYSAWVQKDARNLKVKASSGAATIKPGKVDGNFRLAKTKMSPLWYGKTRVLTLSYDLPAGGPRSSLARKAGYAYADFCIAGPASDKGETRAVVPSGYNMATPDGMRASTKGGKTTFTSGFKKSKPWTFSACLTGANRNAWSSKDIVTPGGRTITISAWKDDPTWSGAVTAAVTEDLAKLEGVLGTDGAPATMTVREGRDADVGSSHFDADTGTLGLGEWMTDRATNLDQIARATWFNSASFPEGWLAGGYLAWAKHEAALAGATCDDPGTPPSPTDDLTIWVRPGASAGSAGKASWAWKNEAACRIVRSTADALGHDTTIAILAAFRAGANPWTSSVVDASDESPSQSWQRWLDLVTEQGLTPKGVDPKLVTDLLLAYGVTSDAELIAAHARAAAGYHALVATLGGSAPAFITDAMRTWDLAGAQAAIDAANLAWTTAADVQTALPAVKADGGKVRLAVIAAATQADLDAAVSMAKDQLALATDVADAIAISAAPRDTLQALGLIGTTLPDQAVAIDAVAKADRTAATETAMQIRTTIQGARDAGTGRAAIIGGSLAVLLLLLGMAVFVGRRRASSRRLAAAASSTLSGPGLSNQGPSGPVPSASGIVAPGTAAAALDATAVVAVVPPAPDPSPGTVSTPIATRPIEELPLEAPPPPA
jgi:hypothetical protein